MTRREDPYQKKAGPLTWILRVAVLFVVVAGCLAATMLLYTFWRAGASAGSVVIEGGNPNLSAPERLYLQMQLSLRMKIQKAKSPLHR